MSAAVKDVPARFACIPQKVRPSTFFGSTKRYLGARNTSPCSPLETCIPWPDYTTQVANQFGYLEHFQGVQRIGRRLVLSAGIPRGRQRSQLVVIDMGSRPERGPWALPQYADNGYSYSAPAPTDRVLHVTDVDDRLWHAGGIQAAEGIVGIPVYATDELSQGYSEVHFYDCNTIPPRKVAVLPKPHMQAKAVGLLRWDQRWLASIWDEKAPHRLHLQLSLGPRLEDGFAQPHLVHRDFEPAQFHPSDSVLPGAYQSVNLVRDTADGALYVVATRNSQQASPFVPGADHLDLFRVRWTPDGEPGWARVEHVAGKQMYCYDQQCNFGGPAGIYTEDEEHLWLYAAAHYLHDGNKRANFNEYACLCVAGSCA